MFEETLQNNFDLINASPFGISSSGLASVGAVGSIGNGIGIASQAVKPVQKEIKRPNWDRNHVTFWFRSMEAHFELDRITEERTKFLYIVASLPAAVLAQVPNESALDAQQPGCYEALKKAVIEAGPALFESTRDRRCPQCGQFPKPRFSAKGPLCWYHFNFGMMAHKCTKPTCQWLKFPEPATSAE